MDRHTDGWTIEWIVVFVTNKKIIKIMTDNNFSKSVCLSVSQSLRPTSLKGSVQKST